MTRTWIVYNKPKEPSYTHAGMLMGLGLTGVSLVSESLCIVLPDEKEKPDRQTWLAVLVIIPTFVSLLI